MIYLKEFSSDLTEQLSNLQTVGLDSTDQKLTDLFWVVKEHVGSFEALTEIWNNCKVSRDSITKEKLAFSKVIDPSFLPTKSTSDRFSQNLRLELREFLKKMKVRGVEFPHYFFLNTEKVIEKIYEVRPDFIDLWRKASSLSRELTENETINSSLNINHVKKQYFDLKDEIFERIDLKEAILDIQEALSEAFDDSKLQEYLECVLEEEMEKVKNQDDLFNDGVLFCGKKLGSKQKSSYVYSEKYSLKSSFSRDVKNLLSLIFQIENLKENDILYWHSSPTFHVEVREFIGEGRYEIINSDNIPRAIKVCVNDPSFGAHENFRVMSLQAAFGNGNADDAEHDNILLIHSKMNKGQVFVVYECNKKESRYCINNQYKKSDSFGDIRKNPAELINQRVLDRETLEKIFQIGLCADFLLGDGSHSEESLNIEAIQKNGTIHIINVKAGTSNNSKPELPRYLSPSFDGISDTLPEIKEGRDLPKEVTNLFQLIKSEKSNQIAHKILNELLGHTWVINFNFRFERLSKHKDQIKSKSILHVISVVELLQKNIFRICEEIRAVLRLDKSDERTLGFHIKLLESFVIGAEKTNKVVGNYSIHSVMPLLEASEQIIEKSLDGINSSSYEALLLLSKDVPLEIQKNWHHFIGELRTTNISSDKISSFYLQMEIMKKVDALSTWFVSYFSVIGSKEISILEKIDLLLMNDDSLLTAQRLACLYSKVIHRDEVSNSPLKSKQSTDTIKWVISCVDEKSFMNIWSQKNSPSNLIMVKLMRAVVEKVHLLIQNMMNDVTIKSHEKLECFKEFLPSYINLMELWLVSAYTRKSDVKTYVRDYTFILQKLVNLQDISLLDPSPGFSFVSSVYNDETMHLVNPDKRITFCDMQSLIYANLMNAVNIKECSILKDNVVMAMLPPTVKSTFAKFSEVFGYKLLMTKIFLKEKYGCIHFNLPIYGSFADFEIEFNHVYETRLLKVSFVAAAEQKMRVLAAFLHGLDLSKDLPLDKTLYSSEKILTWFWRIDEASIDEALVVLKEFIKLSQTRDIETYIQNNPTLIDKINFSQNIEKILDVASGLNEHNMGIGIIIDRLLKSEEKNSKFYQKLIENPSLIMHSNSEELQTMYLEYLSSSLEKTEEDYPLPSQLEFLEKGIQPHSLTYLGVKAAQIGLKAEKWTIPKKSRSLLCKLIEMNHGIRETIEISRNWSKGSKCDGHQFYRELIERGYCQKEALEIGKRKLNSNFDQELYQGFSLLTYLMINNVRVEEIQGVLYTGLHSEDHSKQKKSLQLYKRFAKQGCAYEEAFSAVKYVYEHKLIHLSYEVYFLIGALIEKKQYVDECINYFSGNMEDFNNVYCFTLDFLAPLIKQGKYFDQALKIAVKLSHRNVKSAFELFILLIDRGVGHDEAIEVATKAAYYKNSTYDRKDALNFFMLLAHRNIGHREAAEAVVQQPSGSCDDEIPFLCNKLLSILKLTMFDDVLYAIRWMESAFTHSGFYGQDRFHYVVINRLKLLLDIVEQEYSEKLLQEIQNKLIKKAYEIGTSGKKHSFYNAESLFCSFVFWGFGRDEAVDLCLAILSRRTTDEQLDALTRLQRHIKQGFGIEKTKKLFAIKSKTLLNLCRNDKKLKDFIKEYSPVVNL